MIQPTRPTETTDQKGDAKADDTYRLTTKGRAYVALMSYIDPGLRLEAVNALWAEIGGIVDSQNDLLAACKAAEYAANHVDCISAMQHALPAIRAAIAKAEGGAA